MRALKTLAVLAATTALTACVTPHSGNDGMYALPIGDAPVTANPTAYTDALECLAGYAQVNNVPAPRIAVGRIIDYTGSVSEEGGRRITQGASLMAMSAFNKAGARLVERFDTSVTELELRYANNRLIGQEGDENVRRIYAGQMPGSDFYFVGGITELNYNIRSVGVDAQGGHTDARDGVGNIGARLYVMNIGLDFRLIDTRTLEVVDVISYQKQIIGREVRAGVFSFFDDTFLDIAAGERALEPVQLAVRAGVERAVVEVMSRFYRADSLACAEAINAEGDPMGPGQEGAVPQSAASVLIQQEQARRESADAWHARRDDNIADLRGRS
ncbi:MAG TPA: holdfast anchoring protein HfaB [Vitreimonas sp.]|uniref:holdfast anchoring protein HfaB n=1 Tax=Vitreimonas sp. TaxID=3069702 RepID=UPI002D3733CD|nr:holdfast anchoring protein HfaB [Vitreimonas sp.]HYD88554.1 holdfast anchoring protein HfaB [Vitreimonas sp.]